jgi:hypothetical protein
MFDFFSIFLSQPSNEKSKAPSYRVFDATIGLPMILVIDCKRNSFCSLVSSLLIYDSPKKYI